MIPKRGNRFSEKTTLPSSIGLKACEQALARVHFALRRIAFVKTAAEVRSSPGDL
jgi:hypothetical protein